MWCKTSNPACTAIRNKEKPFEFINYLSSVCVCVCVCVRARALSLSLTGIQLFACPTLCDPMDSSVPDSSVHRILQARIPDEVAISYSKRSPRFREDNNPLQADYLSPNQSLTQFSSVQLLSRGRLLATHATQWTAAAQPACPSQTPEVYPNSCPLSP